MGEMQRGSGRVPLILSMALMLAAVPVTMKLIGDGGLDPRGKAADTGMPTCVDAMGCPEGWYCTGILIERTEDGERRYCSLELKCLEKDQMCRLERVAFGRKSHCGYCCAGSYRVVEENSRGRCD